MLKKTNAILTLIVIAVSLMHMVATSIECIMNSFSEPPIPVLIILYISFGLHAALSMGILFFNKSDSGKIYAKQNILTLEQRISAIILLVLTFFHYAMYCGGRLMHELLLNKSVIAFILLLLFDIAFISHVQSSLERALTTLGINVKPLRIILRTLILIIFILAAVAAVVLFFIH